ncbi:MAG: hypothetical protein ACP59X_21490 [Solidesulfovibrio sp. DCME]|uniref:hypothetical protein n=1 Tax=Solidesulfovibrio sp. DCME TaxID=3447380 RepID=UPI003D145CA2
MSFDIWEQARRFLNGEVPDDDDAARRAREEAEAQTNAAMARQRGLFFGADGEDETRISRMRKRQVREWQAIVNAPSSLRSQGATLTPEE